MGVVSCFGVGANALFDGLRSGESRFSLRSICRNERYPALAPVFAAFVEDFSVVPFLGRKGIRMLSRESQFLMSAAVLAARDAAIDFDSSERYTTGIVVGTTLGGLADYVELFTDGLAYGIDRINPSQGPQTGFNAPAAQLSVHFGIQGPNITLNTGATSALNAVAYAADFIRSGEMKLGIAGGVDALSFFGAHALIGANQARCSTEGPRPFDAGRAGMVYGEAAAVLVVEDAMYAAERGARKVAELRSAATAYEPGIGRADLEAACRRAILNCLDDAQIAPSEIDAVFASACGDRVVDAAEAFAIHGTIGERAPVCAVKGGVGECLGAGAGLELASAVMSIATGVVPGTTGFTRMDPELPPLNITREALEIRPKCVLVNSVDQNGHAAVAVLSRI